MKFQSLVNKIIKESALDRTIDDLKNLGNSEEQPSTQPVPSNNQQQQPQKQSFYKIVPSKSIAGEFDLFIGNKNFITSKNGKNLEVLKNILQSFGNEQKIYSLIP